MKPSYLFLPLALLLAGCSTCPQSKHATAANTLTGKEQSGCARSADLSGGQYRLSDIASEAVFDKSGNQVARLDDLTMSAGGRVISVTLAPASGSGKVTIPFEKLRIKKERNGSITLETDALLKAPAEEAPASPPHKWFHWKKPA